VVTNRNEGIPATRSKLTRPELTRCNLWSIQMITGASFITLGKRPNHRATGVKKFTPRL